MNRHAACFGGCYDLVNPGFPQELFGSESMLSGGEGEEGVDVGELDNNVKKTCMRKEATSVRQIAQDTRRSSYGSR